MTYVKIHNVCCSNIRELTGKQPEKAVRLFAPSRQSSSRRPNPYLLLVMVITDGKFTSFMGDHGNGINAPVLLSNFQP